MLSLNSDLHKLRQNLMKLLSTSVIGRGVFSSVFVLAKGAK